MSIKLLSKTTTGAIGQAHAITYAYKRFLIFFFPQHIQLTRSNVLVIDFSVCSVSSGLNPDGDPRTQIWARLVNILISPLGSVENKRLRIIYLETVAARV